MSEPSKFWICVLLVVMVLLYGIYQLVVKFLPRRGSLHEQCERTVEHEPDTNRPPHQLRSRKRDDSTH